MLQYTEMKREIKCTLKGLALVIGSWVKVGLCSREFS